MAKRWLAKGYQGQAHMANFDNDPFRSPEPQQSGDNGRGLVMAVAVINYVFGGMCLACGVCTGVLGGGAMSFVLAEMGNSPQIDPEAKVGIGIASAVILAIAGVTSFVGLLTLIAGFGVQKFREWGRILTIVLAVISALLGILSLLSLSPVGLVQIGYAVFALVVLLNPNYIREFK